MKSEYIIKCLDSMIPSFKCPLNYTKDYELLLAVMLSSRTTDKQVNKVTPKLFKYNIYELNNLDIEVIEDIIRPLGNMKKKSRYIKSIVNRLINESNGKVLNNREFLESLDGVGHKTANVVLNVLFNENTFAVDTHVYRISKILGICNKEDNIKETEQKLMNFFPENKWGNLHHQMVLFGRNICTNKKPKCDECLFKNKCIKYK